MSHQTSRWTGDLKSCSACTTDYCNQQTLHELNEDKHKECHTNVEVCDLESLLLRQLQHHLDVICVESAQRVPSQQRHLLPRAVP